MHFVILSEAKDPYSRQTAPGICNPRSLLFCHFERAASAREESKPRSWQKGMELLVETCLQPLHLQRWGKARRPRTTGERGAALPEFSDSYFSRATINPRTSSSPSGCSLPSRCVTSAILAKCSTVSMFM